MRTTISIDDALLDRLKKKAVQEGATVSRLVTQAVQVVLSERDKPEEAKPFQLVTFGKGGSGPKVDVSRTGRIFEMEDQARLK